LETSRRQIVASVTVRISGSTSNRKAPGTLDRRRYARRNRIERMMGFLKQFRRVAPRYDKTAASFLSFVQLAAIHRWMGFVHTA
jgi:transposase